MPVHDLRHAVLVDLPPRLLGDVAAERTHIILGLEAQEIIGAEIAHQLAVYRERQQQLRCREGDVQEEADAVDDTETAQLGGERDEMIVMDPDQIVGLEQRGQLLGKDAVDPLIPFIGGTAEIREADPIVEQRPEHAIGEADVEILIVIGIEVDGGIGDLPRRHQFGRQGLSRGRLAAPAEPEPAAPLQGLAQRDRQTAGPRALLIGQRQTVGDDHQPRQNASSQLFDSRMAQTMSPTSE